MEFAAHGRDTTSPLPSPSPSRQRTSFALPIELAVSEHAQLVTSCGRRTELRGVQLFALLVQAQAPPCGLELHSQEISKGPASAHACAEIGVIERAAAHLADQTKDVVDRIRHVVFQLLCKELLYFKRETKQDVARIFRASQSRGLKHAVKFPFVKRWNNWRKKDGGGRTTIF